MWGCKDERVVVAYSEAPFYLGKLMLVTAPGSSRKKPSAGVFIGRQSCEIIDANQTARYCYLGLCGVGGEDYDSRQ